MWGVVYTHAQKEFEAQAQIENQGWTCYLPKHLKSTRHARKTSQQIAPLFPRYLFIDFAEKPFSSSLNYTKGVQCILTNGATPSTVSEQIIALLRSKEDEQGYVETKTIMPFVKGDPMIVKSGCFKGQIATFECMNDHQRVQLLIDLLGKKTSVTLNINEITAF